MNKKSNGPRNRKEATALVAHRLIKLLQTVPADEMLHLDLHEVKMTGIQLQRLEAAARDIEARLRKLAGE